MKKCKVCGEMTKKRNVCASCKEKYPYSPSGKGSRPFNRMEVHRRLIKTKVFR